MLKSLVTRPYTSFDHSSKRLWAQVGQWKKAIQEQVSTVFEGKRGPQPVDAYSEPERLYSEIGRLKIELDWLKKKSGVCP